MVPIRMTNETTLRRLRIVVGMICLLLAVVAVPNFLSFRSHSLEIGGSALNGFVQEGQYFVVEHGKQTEVSREEFNKSFQLGKILLWTWPPMVFAALLFVFQSKLSRSDDSYS